MKHSEIHCTPVSNFSFFLKRRDLTERNGSLKDNWQVQVMEQFDASGGSSALLAPRLTERRNEHGRGANVTS